MTYAPAATAANTPPIYFAVLSGPAASPATPAFPVRIGQRPTCAAGEGAGHEQCLVANGRTASTNTIDVFANNNAVPDATFDAGDQISRCGHLVFAGVPSAISISPTSITPELRKPAFSTPRLATDALDQLRRSIANISVAC